MTVSLGGFGVATCCDEAPWYAANAATAEAIATNAGIAAHCLRLVIQCNPPYRLEEDGDVVNFFTKSFGARYDAQAVDRSQDLERHGAEQCDLARVGCGTARE